MEDEREGDVGGKIVINLLRSVPRRRLMKFAWTVTRLREIRGGHAGEKMYCERRRIFFAAVRNILRPPMGNT